MRARLGEREDLNTVNVAEMPTSALVREVARFAAQERKLATMPERYAHDPKLAATVQRTVDNICDFVGRCAAELDRRVPVPGQKAEGRRLTKEEM